jgi:hypothetical protein
MIFDSISTGQFNVEPWSSVFVETIDGNHGIDGENSFDSVSGPARHFNVGSAFTLALG